MTSGTTRVANPGLEGVVVADTEISEVDGERGRLVIAGADVEQLAASTGFEGAVRAVLAAGGADPAALGDAADAGLGAARAAAWERVARLGDALEHPDAMDALRTALGHLRPQPGGADTADAIAAIGAAPVFVAAWHRRRAGQPPIAPDPALGHAADYLRMTLGRAADADRVRALDAYLVTVVDHAMCASTFTARVIASTASDLVSAMVGAVGALKGPLHGGAPSHVSHMIDEIGTAENAEPWLRRKLEAGEVLMGFG
ncbi:MAG TPA: citrate/2-methylcitrate synthase, partial [Kofleriaceae bacterium]|nr:citrate/2-methylcitrate synthase [Kofleriaceae bacterium]